MELVTEQTSYRSHPQFNISDHKPVTSEFTVNVSPTHKFSRLKTGALWPFHSHADEQASISFNLLARSISNDWNGHWGEFEMRS